MAKGKNSNPVDAFRKLQKAKELKKNKENRSKLRENHTVKRDTRELEAEIKELKSRSKLASADSDRLKSLESEVAYINKVKEKYVSEHPEARDRIFRKPNAGSRGPGGGAGGVGDDDGEGGGSGAGPSARAGQNMSHLYDEQGRLRDPKRSVYYHEVYNPFGVPPPGLPYRERTPSEADEEIGSDEDEEDDSDDEIIMPEGPPPGVGLSGEHDEDADSDGSDDSDDIPLPAGPPPPKAVDPASIPTGPRSNIPQMRPPLHFTGPPGAPPPPISLGHGPGPAPGPGAFAPGQPPLPPAPPIPSAPPAPSPYQQNFGQMAPWGALQSGPSSSGPRPPRRQPHHAPSVQDPLSDAPTQTYQGYRMAKADLPAKPPAPSSPAVSTPALPAGLPAKPGSSQAPPMAEKKPSPAPTSDILAAATVTAAPQLRDLRKEAVAFVPRGVKRKAGTAGGVAGAGSWGPSMGRINATPGAGQVDEDGDEIRVKRQDGPGLMGVLKGVLGDGRPAADGSGSVQAGAKGEDDYQKFLDGLNDLS